MALPFFGIWMKTDLFQSCVHCWVYQIFWHIECSIFTASSFRIWYSSIGIPSSPLALFVVMLPKAHLTSHSRMSGSRWMITPLWLSGSWTSFFFFFSQCPFNCLKQFRLQAVILLNISLFYIRKTSPYDIANIFLMNIYFSSLPLNYPLSPLKF